MGVVTTKEKRYEERERYVNEVLNETFKPVEDVRDIRYAVANRDILKEVVRVESWLGMIAYLDVTALPEEDILKSVVHLTVAEGEPKNVIADPAEIRKVARLF